MVLYKVLSWFHSELKFPKYDIFSRLKIICFFVCSRWYIWIFYISNTILDLVDFLVTIQIKSWTFVGSFQVFQINCQSKALVLAGRLKVTNKYPLPQILSQPAMRHAISIFIICLLLIFCCDWSDHGHMTTLQNWYWGAIFLSNTQSCQVHVLNSQLELLKRNPTEVNWDKELRGVWASCEIMIMKGIKKHILRLNKLIITFLKQMHVTFSSYPMHIS